MSELAAHLVDRVLLHVPIRQWMFTVPVPVRYQLAFDAALTRAVLPSSCAPSSAGSGSVTAIQRFGAALNFNGHFHALLFDGVYTRATPAAPSPPPDPRDRAHHAAWPTRPVPGGPIIRAIGPIPTGSS